MLLLEWLVPLLIGAVALAGLAKRLGVPYPAFLALGGAGLAMLPSGPNLVLEPELALALFVAPIIVDTAYDASLRDLRANWLPITLLVLAAVGVTTVAVAIVARILVPDLPWGAAIALGAIVAPPDATAATAVLRQVRLPHRITVVLEGESLLNDASALFLYRLAVGAVTAGSFHAETLVTSFILVLPLSLAAGWALSHFTVRLMSRIEDVPASIVMQFSLTFGIWMLADRLHLSPVLVTVAYATTISHGFGRRFEARRRIPAFAVWETVTFMLNVLAFVVIGLQLRPILAGMAAEKLTASLGFAITILGVCVLARMGWIVFYQLFWLQPFGHGRSSLPRGIPDRRTFARGGMVIGWSGMRGIVTLAAAFALPDGSDGGLAFPHRDLILLTAFTVVLGTLVIQGLTLRMVAGWARLEDDDPVGREVGQARTEINRAALDAIANETGPIVEGLRAEYADILAQAERAPDGFAPARTERDDLRLRAIAAARDRLHRLRATGVIGNNAFSRIEEELDRAEVSASHV